MCAISLQKTKCNSECVQPLLVHMLCIVAIGTISEVEYDHMEWNIYLAYQLTFRRYWRPIYRSCLTAVTLWCPGSCNFPVCLKNSKLVPLKLKFDSFICFIYTLSDIPYMKWNIPVPPFKTNQPTYLSRPPISLTHIQMIC